MAEIFRDKRLPDYFATCSWDDKSSLDGLVERYEAGDVVVLANKRIEFDVDFFSRISFPPDREYKKFKAVQFVESFRRGGDLYPSLAEDCFSSDRGEVRHFADQLSQIIRQMAEIVRKVAPGYRISAPRLTLRCSQTFNENLHFDVYKEEIRTHHFRMFVNLDAAHRIWRTSWRTDELLDRRLSELPRKSLETLSSGMLLKALNFHVFGGYDGAFEDRGAPMHVAYFEPGDIWFVDSRKVSHQIFYGRRAISSESVVEESCMADPETHYYRMTEKARRAALSRASVAV